MRSSKALLAALFLLLVPVHAWAGSGLLMGLGKPPSVGGGYSGPIDAAGATAQSCYSLRACSAAIAATGTAKAVQVTNTSTAETCDVLITTAGGLGNVASCSGSSSGTAVATFCGANCRIGIWYDQVGGIDASSGSGPTLAFNCLNTTKPCAVFNGSNYLAASASPSTNPPLSISAVAIRTSGGGQQDILTSSTGIYFFGAFNSGFATGYFGAQPAGGSEADNAWHAMQFVVDGVTPGVNVDGTFTAGSFSTSPLAAAYYLGAQSSTPTNPLTGKMAEVILFTASLGGSAQTATCHNQFTYWATSTSC